jgi:hypothetical protein
MSVLGATRASQNVEVSQNCPTIIQALFPSVLRACRLPGRNGKLGSNLGPTTAELAPKPCSVT